MKVSLANNKLTVTREKNYPTESAWWYDLKKTLNAQGHDLIKKVMSKDGHMVGGDTYPYYLRDRKGKYCFFDNHYAEREVNKPESVSLLRWDFV